jgi:hypothetical protein
VAKNVKATDVLRSNSEKLKKIKKGIEIAIFCEVILLNQGLVLVPGTGNRVPATFGVGYSKVSVSGIILQ